MTHDIKLVHICEIPGNYEDDILVFGEPLAENEIVIFIDDHGACTRIVADDSAKRRICNGDRPAGTPHLFRIDPGNRTGLVSEPPR